MQYILTQQEYDKLVARSDENLMDRYEEIRDKLSNLRIDYAKLLVFGVSTNNEKLKQ